MPHVRPAYGTSRDDQARTTLDFANAASLALIATASDGTIRFVNAAAAKLFEYEPEEMVGRSIDLIVPPAMRGAHNRGMARVAAGGETKLVGTTVEVNACRRDGSEFPIEISLSVWKEGDGVGMGAIIRDISERRQRDQKLMRLAHQDTLTGLCNRQTFERRLGELFDEKRSACVVLFDLDGFKEVNDSVGHRVGDALLQAIAVRLPAVLGDEALVARLRGDEFAVLLPDVGEPLSARAVVDTIADAFGEPFELGSNVFQLSASIGYAIGPAHGEDAEELIASADFALYHAKRGGGRHERLFEPAMRSESAEKRGIQDELLKALKSRELELHYQPQVLLSDGSLFGVEALLRWRHATRGLLSPASFLPVIDTSSLALPVGRFVIDTAIAQLATWRAEGFDGIRMGINLFAAQLRAGTLVCEVRNALRRHGVAPELLELEITETIALHSDSTSHEAIAELRALGVKVAFDDFGTGYASLYSLKQFPLTTLKIDRGFVRDLLASSQDTAIMRAMVGMGAELGLETIVEGIETSEQARLLMSMGCERGQGYLYGKPMPAADIAGLMRCPLIMQSA